jgi:hypothetical protein
MNTSESIDNIAPAFLAAQRSFETISKDAANPFFNSKYADITSILSMALPVLHANDLVLTQSLAPADKGVMIETSLLHASGEWISDDYLMIPAAKEDPQAYGSAITYGRRYAMLAFLCLATEDDDGNSASQGMSKIEAAKAARAQRE